MDDSDWTQPPAGPARDLADLVARSPLGIVVLRRERLLFCNRAAERLLGLAPPPAPDRPADERRAPPAELVRLADQAAAAGAGPQGPAGPVRLHCRRADGGPIHLEVMTGGVEWEGAAAVQLVLRAAELPPGPAALGDSGDRYRLLVEQSLQGIAVYGLKDQRALFANEAMVRLAGAGSAAAFLAEVRLFSHMREPYASALRAAVERLAAGELPSVRDEALAVRVNGEAYWAEYNASRVDWNGEPALQLVLLDITARKQAEEAMKDRTAVLARQNEYFRSDLSRRRERGEEGIVAESPGMQRVLHEAEMVAASRVPVVIEGETGTGKEVVAEFLHRHSDRAEHILSVVNCGALTESLMDAELFGYERGAFTGAGEARAGLIEIADGGTLFLDEIGDLPPSGQVRLLRFLEKGVIRRVGSNREKPVDVRIVAATHRQLKREVLAGTFREDLYHRLLVIRIEVPPLRERIEDILALAEHFNRRYAAESRQPPRSFADETRLALASYSWPGNVRELSHTMQRAVLAAQLDGSELIRPEHLDLPVRDASESVLLPLKEVTRRAERQHVLAALRYFNGNRRKAAESLGVSERHLYRLLQ